MRHCPKCYDNSGIEDVGLPPPPGTHDPSKCPNMPQYKKANELKEFSVTVGEDEAYYWSDSSGRHGPFEAETEALRDIIAHLQAAPRRRKCDPGCSTNDDPPGSCDCYFR